MKLPSPDRLHHFLLVAVAAIMASLLLSACAQPSAPSVNVNVNVVNMVTVSAVFGAPVPSGKSGCPAIGRIDVKYPTAMDKNAQADISATPRTAEGNQREADCDIADGINWSFAPSALASIGDPSAFETKLTAGKDAGKGSLSVSVGRASASFPVEIR